jgi:hypothetical protein
MVRIQNKPGSLFQFLTKEKNTKFDPKLRNKTSRARMRQEGRTKDPGKGSRFVNSGPSSKAMCNRGWGLGSGMWKEEHKLCLCFEYRLS